MTRWALLTLLATGCGGAGGPGADAAFLAGRHAEAAARWRQDAESGEPEAWARVGHAAMRSGDAVAAVGAWRALASAVPTRRLEAVEGLRRTARAAERAGDLAGLREAMTALAALAPEVPLMRHAARLVREGDADLLPWLPAALAAAGSPADTEALLLELARRRQLAGGCATALEAWGAALRRATGPADRAAALEGYTACGLALGDAALAADPAAAEGWYRRVVEVAPAAPAGRRALIGVGDARVRQGDLLGAALAWQSVIGEGGDSLAATAARRLNNLANAAGPENNEE